MTFDQKNVFGEIFFYIKFRPIYGVYTITTFGKFVRNMTRKVAKDTMHDELGCGTSRNVVNNYIRITSNVHEENVEGRK